MAAWIKMPLGMKVGLYPGDFVLGEELDHPPQKGGGALPQIFGPCLLWPNGWMDQDGTWHEGRPQPRRLYVTWGPIPPPQKWGRSSPNFWPIFIVAKRLDGSKRHLARR